MRQTYSTTDDVIAAAVREPLDADAVYTLCRSEALTVSEFTNALSLTIASRFDQSLMSFEEADHAMNQMWRLMLDYTTRIDPQVNIWEPTYSIYCAFDEGEWDHGGGENPVKRFTKPAVQAILAKWR